jgi:hypothetical protein
LWRVANGGQVIFYLPGAGVKWYDLVSDRAEYIPAGCHTPFAFAFRGECTQAISAGGRFLVFSSYAYDLVPGDMNFANDLFVYDHAEAHIERISPTSRLRRLLVVLAVSDLIGASMLIWAGRSTGNPVAPGHYR